jgi:hypothetical protein
MGTGSRSNQKFEISSVTGKSKLDFRLGFQNPGGFDLNKGGDKVN